MHSQPGQDRAFQLNKLVRDGIVESTRAQGGEVKLRGLSGEELQQAIANKMVEEAQELNPDNATQELADLQELIDQYAANANITKADIARAQDEKRTKVGGFKNGDFIETVILPADNEWAAYYASNPARFPEITEDIT